MKKRVVLIILIMMCIGIIPKTAYAETYEGEYSIDYLLKNYNLVSLGVKDKNSSPVAQNNIAKGNVVNITSIDGAVLINGDYSSFNAATFGTNAGDVKSFIKGTKGDNVTTPSNLVTDSNYIDFNKMYSSIMAQSKSLADKTQYYLDGPSLEISKPGIYTINNVAYYLENVNHYGSSNQLLIKNYDKNNFYVFNYYNEYLSYLPTIYITESSSPNAVPLKDYIENGGTYTGNIIFNFPNLKNINATIYNYNSQGLGTSGHIIAPQAEVILNTNYYINGNNYYYGTIIANSIGRTTNYYTYSIKKTPYSLSKKILEEESNYIETPIDYNDDYYSRDYSIKDLLENYSLVTLGHKSIDSKSKLLQFGNTPGSIRVFHITGQSLIAGELYGKTYDSMPDEYFNNFTKFDRTVFDLRCNKVCESYVRGNTLIKLNNSVTGMSVIQPWDNMTTDNIKYYGQKNILFVGPQTYNAVYRNIGPGNYTGEIYNYINFDRLYNNVVTEQGSIAEGSKVNTSNVTHIKVGGQYVIDDINQIDKIVFDNFDEEKDKLTIITIKNEGDINFPLISKDKGSYKGIVTNDYYGKEQATHLYEQNTFVQDSYHGNIIWNVPNATYIKLKENAPFAGHLIAPKADVDTPELHFAGCFIVNSIYGEGNTEAHFYPITAKALYEVPEYEDQPIEIRQRINNRRLSYLLGGEGSTVETNVIGDEAKYQEDEELINNILKREAKPSNTTPGEIIENLIINPLTKGNLGIILIIIGSVIGGIILIKKGKIIKG